MRHHGPDSLKGSNSLCHNGSPSDAMGEDIFKLLSQELCNPKCQLETCPGAQEVTVELNVQVLETLWYLESMVVQQNDFRHV